MYIGARQDALTEEQQTFLERLFRLINLQQDEMWGQLNEVGRTLVRRAIYAVYCDCVDAGASAEAQWLLERLPRGTAVAAAAPAGASSQSSVISSP